MARLLCAPAASVSCLSLSMLVVLAVSPVRGQLVNGSFEDGAFVDNSSHTMSVPVGSTIMTGWTTVSGELAWGTNDNPFVGAAATDGTKFLDLTGFHDSVPFGGVTQTVTTIPGHSYTLSFDLLCYQSDSRYSGPVGLQASADSTSQSFTFTPPVGSTGEQSGHFSLPFTATGSSTVITLQGTLAAGGQFLGLDNVSLVPEPVAAGLVGLAGILALATRSRRRPQCA